MSTSININSTQISALLQLYPMAIPGAVENLQPPGAYHLGIPESIHSPSTNLFMVIDPVTLFSTPFAAGDSVRLWVNSQATSVIKPIKPGEENDRIFMELPWRVLKNGLNTLYYEVTRISGNKDQSTPILNVLFNDPVSGITVSHPPSIGPGTSATVTLTRSDPRQFDEVELIIGSWSRTIPYVHPANPITYTLTTIDLQQIGDGTHTVNATIKDQLSNLRVSPTTSIVISANTLVLPPPTVKGQTGNNFNPTLQNIEVLVPAGTLLPTDKIYVKWEGAISTPAASYTSAQRLVSAGLTFVVPRSVLAYSLGKAVKVIYVIERNGVSTPSQVLPLNILPLPATALIPPKILEADANNVLDVTALGTQNATIHALLWTLIAAGMPCWLSLAGEKSDGSAHNLDLWKGLPAQVNSTWVNQGYWPAALVNSYLKQLGDGTSLRIKFAVSMDMSNVRATAVEFPDRVYTVKLLVLVVPTLTDVLDTGNQQVVEGGVTISTTLKLKGKASIGQQVEIFDGNGPSAVSKGKATANTAGDWELTITVAAGVRRLYAQSLYHPGNPVYSNVRNLTVVTNIVPRIQLITDSNKVTIPSNGSTISTSIIVSGIATPGTKIDLVDGGGPIAGLPEIQVDAQGEWSQTMTNLVPGKTYNLRAKSKDGPVSGAYNVTIVANIVPIIQLITDSNKVTIPSNGSTISTSIIVSGIATPGTKIDLVDHGGPIPGLPEIQVDAQGKWSQTMTNLVVGKTYELRAKRKDGPVSGAYSVIIVATVNATITKVNENTATGALVPNGGSTTAATLVISGTASAGQQVQVLKGGAVVTTVTASPTGIFLYTHADATLGARSYTVRGIYGNSPVSSPYNLTRVNPLSFGSNRTLATSNYHVAQNRPPANPNSTATYTQVPAGGTPPYSLSSSNTGVAVIDGNGRVRAVGNGQAVMTVQDSKGMRASHTVSVSGVVIYYHAASWGAQIMNNAAAMAQSLGGRLPSRAELHALHATYRPEGQPDVVLGWMQTHPFWTYESYPLVNHFWTVYFGNNQESFAHSWQGPCAVAVRLN